MRSHVAATHRNERIKACDCDVKPKLYGLAYQMCYQKKTESGWKCFPKPEVKHYGNNSVPDFIVEPIDEVAVGEGSAARASGKSTTVLYLEVICLL